MLSENMRYDTDKWSYLEQWIEDCYWDTFYDIENLIDYWEDDRIDRMVCGFVDWLRYPGYSDWAK
jgi:hypothetical protein